MSLRAVTKPSTRAIFIAIVAGAATFASMGLLVYRHLEPFGWDADISRWASTHVNDGAAAAVRAVTNLAGNWIIIAVTASVALYSYIKTRLWRAAGFLLMASAGQWALSNTVKQLVERPRPAINPLVIARGWSFPSGHATGAAATYLAIALVLGLFVAPRTRVFLVGAAIGLAVVVAGSRVLLGVHWSSDVVAGLILGWTWCGVCYLTFGGPYFRNKTLGLDPRSTASTEPG